MPADDDQLVRADKASTRKNDRRSDRAESGASKADADAEGGSAEAPEAKATDVKARDVVPVRPPPFRRLRVYAFDPSLATQMETAVVNQVTLKVPWETNIPPDLGGDKPDLDQETRELRPGPVGEYLEVVDYDPASGFFYPPVDLNDRALLAQDGLPPSEGDPRFHQQMVYAVAMTTIRHFERALGRLALWSGRKVPTGAGKPRREFVRRLRIYPHALREANAYYSPDKKAVLFGYFPASATDPGGHLPGGTVFTCLSHDIIAHETTHALLDGLHERFIEASNRDVLAFHEAFADIVALFQHFSMPQVLRHQIAKVRGDLTSQSLLGDLARQFGHATGRRGALRSAIGRVNPATGVPDPTELSRTHEPHERGAILMAAVFDAFTSIYTSRVADLLRISTGGTGMLAAGDLHPDLVNRLADQAARAASHVLNMCIRALDYCPPVDITFGEYVRALITADFDLVRDDDLCYRVAFIEAFRRRGIYPRDVRTLSEESLRWQPPANPLAIAALLPPRGTLREHVQAWDLTVDRQKIHDQLERFRGWLHDEMLTKMTPTAAAEMKLDMGLKDKGGRVRFEVHSARPARRIGPDGQQLMDLVVVVTQSRQARYGAALKDLPPRWEPDFDADCTFRGGCTLLVDLDEDEPPERTVRYCIRKSMVSERRWNAQSHYGRGHAGRSLRATYFGRGRAGAPSEPFALLHRSHPEEADDE